MKDIVITLLYITLIISLFGIAGFLMFHQVSGWGWFLLLTFITVASVEIKVK